MKEMYSEEAFQAFIESLVLDTESSFTKVKKNLVLKTVAVWNKEDSKEYLERE
jgi:hypothetical protein